MQRLLLILCVTLVVPVVAEATDAMEGKWTGSFKLADGRRLTTEINLTEETVYRWSGTIRVLVGTDETQMDLEDVRVTGTTASFNFKLDDMPAPAYFRGRYDPARRQIRGTYTVSGRELDIRYKRIEDALPSFRHDESDTAGYETDLSAILPPRHETHFGVAVRGALWKPIYIIKENTRNINDVATSSFGFDAGVRWYVIDGMALIARRVQGGLNFDTTEEFQLQTGITGTEFEEIKGWEVGINAYLGNRICPKSKCNPYLTGVVGDYDWAFQEDGPGSDSVVLPSEKVPLEGTVFGFGAGLGTEYRLNDRFLLEVEWLWRYIMTEDEDACADTVTRWTNTHLWNVTLGLVMGF